MTSPAVHPALAGLEFLLGRWRGSGRGEYPTIDSFTYREEVEFTHAGKPFLVYHQRTWDQAGAPLHTEVGYLRPIGTDTAELVIAQPTGVTEIHTGDVAGTSLRLTAAQIGLSPTAKSVTAVTRQLEVAGNELTYRLEMAAVGQELQLHLEATLRRVDNVAV